MLELIDLSYEADGKQILKTVNLTVNDGELLAVTGNNGGGKTTLAKLVMGIATPTGGRILYNKKDITTMPVTERANLRFAYAFQQPILFKGLTVGELLKIASGANVTVANMCDALSRVGLCARDYLDREFDAKLSGGEQKRIELAIALMRNAGLYIFDEPEAGIDLWSFEKLTELFTAEHATTIIVTHQERILEIADNIVVLRGGEIVDYGTGKEVCQRLTNERCGRLRQ